MPSQDPQILARMPKFALWRGKKLTVGDTPQICIPIDNRLVLVGGDCRNETNHECGSHTHLSELPPPTYGANLTPNRALPMIEGSNQCMMHDRRLSLTNPSLDAQILARTPEFQPKCPNPS